ncbi:MULTISPECIES: tryptophan halogenase family protein [Asticcacaulis]|uniref:tryptophan halogenase family protein n=1 Tax=Asticcacaulis TaxID=76890 RepID=UPI001AEA3EBF|nr:MULTISPECIES: tryptophan halogenase family protein [Asticcacaulis]MBP2159817.1 tryptophan halogenase [Asticcacaulis solisilvae]MDR6800862.1 tryptophan halogenase [Asticcacaulis sp. BE141]
MTESLIKRVIIVGGGTAGWLSATMLARVLNKAAEIIVVESEEIGTVGVGEATIPPLVNLFTFLGIPEHDMLSKVQGTYKLGIEFVDWLKPASRYIHAFGNPGRDLGIVPFYQYWLRRHLAGRTESLWDYSLNSLASNAHRFAPMKTVPDTPVEGITHAWHFDAMLLARYLRGICEAQGVVRREGKITGVNQRADDGFIESVTLADGEAIAGDLFVDCSGFRGLLIEGALKAGYDDWMHWLPCDRAIAVPCESAGPLLPYTRATAHSAGWQWRIPLQHRIGNGHVFCSAFMDEDEATRILMGNLDGRPLADPRPLQFVTGRRKASWVKNCIAFGLAAGFMEPLESTSIHLVQSGLTRFVKMFPDKGFSPLQIAEYNRQTSHEYELIRDFLVLHYKATERDDSPFWNHCRTMAVPDSLTHKIEYFREYGRLIIEDADLFRESNWVQVLIGQGIVPKTAAPLAYAVGEAQLEEYCANLRTIYGRALNSLPPHDAYIARTSPASQH